MQVAVVGCGYWGPNLVRSIKQIDHATLRMCCDSNPLRLASLSKKFPGTLTTTDYRKVLEDSRVEAVILATPIETHYVLGKQALLSGKHVLIEKPMTNCLAEALELNGLALAKGLTLMVNHTFLYSPPILRIRDIIQSGELGTIYFINMTRVNLGIHSSRSNVIWDLGAHDVSIVMFWLNEHPQEIQAFGRDCIQQGVHDVAYLNMRFPSGPIVNVNMSWLSPSKFRSTVIVGSKKMLVFDDTRSEEKIKIYDRGVDVKPPNGFGEYQLTYRTGDIVSPKVESREPLLEMASHFVDCASNGETPRTSGQNGIDVVCALHYAMESLVNNGRSQRIPEFGAGRDEERMAVL